MATQWRIKATELANCNCAYGCPCQFNALPTHGNCRAIVGIEIERGHHGETPLDNLRIAGVFAWPGPIHEGKGEATVIIDKRAPPPQREALLRIVSRQDTERGATMTVASPLPSWIGPGQAKTPAILRLSSGVSPWWPRSISMPTMARQLPWVGKALN